MAPNPDPERDAPTSNGPTPPKLVKFRHMTGIDTPASLLNKDPGRAGRNLGLYPRIVSEESKATYQYYLMSSIINISFLGQIIVAAALTALGASDGSHIAITILGSVNTVIAGIQTYLKGQGLPNRIKQYQFGLRKLREYIEDRERDFSDKSCKLNVDHVIADVSAMYQAVRQTAEDNTPDTYLPMEGAGKKLLGQKDNRVTAIEQLGPPGGNAEETGGGADTGPENDHVRAAENAEATGAGADTGADAGAGAGADGGTEAGDSGAAETAGTKPNNKDDTEDAPLLDHGGK